MSGSLDTDRVHPHRECDLAAQLQTGLPKSLLELMKRAISFIFPLLLKTQGQERPDSGQGHLPGLCWGEGALAGTARVDGRGAWSAGGSF